MKSFIASTILAFTAIAFASPVERQAPTASISLTNNMSGANFAAAIPLDGVAIPISTAYAGSSIANGGFYASAASLVGGYANNPVCTITNNKISIATLNTTNKTYVKFGSDPNMIQNVDLSGASISCTRAY